MVQNARVTFVYTNSYDRSADLLVQRLGSERTFRFNLDLWREYAIRIEPAGRFSITNPTGRRMTSAEVVKFLWRKPLTTQQLFPDRRVDREQMYEEEELAYAMREAWNRAYLDGRAVLIDPVSDVLAGKLVQAEIATRYFPVPGWTFVAGTPVGTDPARECVVKSLTSLRVGERSVLFTSRVRQGELATQAPWLVQSYVAAEYDVTVVAIRGELFAFELNRAGFPEGVIDWRRARTLASEQPWKRHTLPRAVAEGIRGFMDDMALHYGRLDFLLAGSTYYFLEVNPNGEWGWLDEGGAAGILEALAGELSPETPCHGLPNPRRIRYAGQPSR